jgi:hypothetical protein
MLGHGPIGSAPISSVTPTPFPKKQADLLLKLRGELLPAQLQRWAPFIDQIVEQLGRRGAPRTDRDMAKTYLREQMAIGRKPDPDLIAETAKECLCSKRTVKRALEEMTE